MWMAPLVARLHARAKMQQMEKGESVGYQSFLGSEIADRWRATRALRKVHLHDPQERIMQWWVTCFGTFMYGAV